MPQVEARVTSDSGSVEVRNPIILAGPLAGILSRRRDVHRWTEQIGGRTAELERFVERGTDPDYYFATAKWRLGPSKWLELDVMGMGEQSQRLFLQIARTVRFHLGLLLTVGSVAYEPPPSEPDSMRSEELGIRASPSLPTLSRWFDSVVQSPPALG